MGCAISTKSFMNSPPEGLERLKMGNGYAKGEYAGARRSTGQRHSRQESGRNMKPESRNGSWNNENHVVNGRENFRGNGNVKEGNMIVVDGARTSSNIRGDANKGNANGNVESTNMFEEDELVDGWPKWLADHIPMSVLKNIVLKTADSYTKIDKAGHGTYSNVYKARDKDSGKLVALKKVRFDTSEPESVKFMAREIMILQKLDHPNIVKLEGLATSRMQYSLYLVFDYMYSDLSRIISRPDERLTEPQIKCYMQQLLSGLQHCHEQGILHRDIKGSNLLIDRHGMLKIADFGLGIFFNPDKRRPLTNRVVTLWYRAPELLLGTTDYGVGIDLWSAGCLMAEMFHGMAIMPGRTEIEQLHRIFRLCGTPPDDFYKRLKLSTALKPPKAYKSTIHEVFGDYPLSAFRLLNILLALDPAFRGSASSALQHEFFRASPLPCDLSGLPVIHVEEDDEKYLTTDNRKHRTSRARRRSKSQREHSKKKAVEEPNEDTEGPKEEPQRREEISVFGLDPGSSTTSTSSSSAKPPRTAEIRLYTSPIESNHEMSPRTEAHLYATKNITNRQPLPPVMRRTTKSNYNRNADGANRANRVPRSASTREIRSLENKNRL